MNQKAEEAFEVLSKHLDAGVQLEDVHPRTLKTLQESLKAKDIDFPHEIPERV